eukprot:9439939-Pyramimonas_sp.AAC.1
MAHPPVPSINSSLDARKGYGKNGHDAQQQMLSNIDNGRCPDQNGQELLSVFVPILCVPISK